MEAMAFLVWLAVAFLIGLLWSGMAGRVRGDQVRRFVLGDLTCPSCKAYFKPMSHTCANGLEYCGECKKHGRCGC